MGMHRRIGLRRLRPQSDATRIAEDIREKNGLLLVEDKVSLDQLVGIVRKLQDAISKGQPANEATIDYQTTDLNKLSNEELAQHKAEMDKQFSKTRRSLGILSLCTI